MGSPEVSRMRVGRYARCVVATLLGSLAAAGPASAQPPTDTVFAGRSILAEQPQDILDELESKSWVMTEDDADATFVTALVIFDQPLDRSMSLISQTGRQVEFRPELKANDTLETYEDGTLERQRLKIMFTNIVYHLRYRLDFDKHRVSWDLDTSRENDLKEVSGFWELYAIDKNRTLVKFGTRVDVGSLPSFLQDYATRKNVPKSLQNARRWVSSDGTWRH
jgi:hypothetical protein